MTGVWVVHLYIYRLITRAGYLMVGLKLLHFGVGKEPKSKLQSQWTTSSLSSMNSMELVKQKKPRLPSFCKWFLWFILVEVEAWKRKEQYPHSKREREKLCWKNNTKQPTWTGTGGKTNAKRRARECHSYDADAGARRPSTAEEQLRRPLAVLFSFAARSYKAIRRPMGILFFRRLFDFICPRLRIAR